MRKLNRFGFGTLLLIAGIILANPAHAQDTFNKRVREFTGSNQHSFLKEFLKLLEIPNVASDTANINRNAEFLSLELKKRGLSSRLLRSKNRSVPPVVYGEWMTPGLENTIVFYAHYDGQPVDPSQWNGSSPWLPVLRTAAIKNGGKVIPFPTRDQAIDPNWRIYARSASDDKGGVFAILKAIDVLKSLGITPAVNIKIFFEGEEEAGSSNLREIVQNHKDLLGSDAWIICDGPVHQSGRKQAVFGVRGVTSVDLTVYGANRALHSGHYGNWSPSPGFRLVKLLSTMRDDSGRVLVKGWYEDVEPLDQIEKTAIASAPDYDEELKKQLGLNQTEGQGKSLLELINLPSLNINGMKSGDIGSLARNIIPATANAVIGIRLVKGNDHKRQVEKLKNHIVRQGFYVVDREPTREERLKYPLIAKFIRENAGYNAQRTKMNMAVSRAVVATLKNVAGDDIVTLPTLGGSLPLSIISESLDGVPAITVPIANYDNNQHAANENIRIQNLWDGIEIYANLMRIEF